MSEEKEPVKGSFADRYKKRSSTFTQESLKKPTPQKQGLDELISKAESAKTQKEKKVDPIKKMQADLIYLVKGVDAGRNAWYYVLVERLKLQLFLKALNDDIIHLEEYGKVLFSAYGDEPPSYITDQVKEEYGID